jgi:ATP-dependent helicase Lhr and Lhr-like helicase
MLDGFHPAVRKWFAGRFGSPSRVQELGWPLIGEAQKGAGHDVLLCAPTGSGKTLAAFMWAINRLVVEAEQSALPDQISVLYVSPLKALANDIRINLEEPLAGVRTVAAQDGLNLATIRAGLRTGDTPAGERAAMLRRPPQILVTTPESLFILLTSPRFRQKLSAVRYVIVDELHAIAGNKRGAHLMLTLERLERLVRRSSLPRPTRIGLSATLNPIETLAAFLAGADVAGDGARKPRPIRIVRADDDPRQLDLQIIAPGPELGSLATHQHWEAMYDALAVLIREHRTTLVFTLSRRWAERIALALQKRVGIDAVMAHHGSLARAERLQAEQRLKHGELKAIVATSSLELGIDVGAVDLVCQVDSPKSVAAAVQRIGRSGHHLGGTPKGRFFALTIDDLLECAAAVRALRQGHLDEVEIPAGCMDVAAQQIIAIATDEEEISESQLLSTLRSVQNFAGLKLSSLRQLLSEMAAQLPERIQGASPKIFYDPQNGLVRPRRGARLAAITSGGTIPESGNLDVVVASEGRKIGDVEEDFAQESSRGDIFSLGSMPWRVLGISKNRFLVEAAPGMAPSLPFWQTEAAGRSPALSTELCDLRHRIASSFTNSLADSDASGWLQSECALEPDAATQAIAYVKRGLAALDTLPNDNNLVVERFFDGLGGTQIVIHSPWGIRLNRGLGLALRKRLCQSFDFEIQASAIDDAILLALNSRHSFPLEQLLSMVNSRNVRDVLEQALLDAPMFEVRFRHVATRALSIMRSGRGNKVPAWIQRLRSQELITALFPQRNACFDNRPASVNLPEHFIVNETMRECLEETADISRLETLLRGLEDGSIRSVMVDSIAPSVFAHRVLLAWDYSFLDDGERANRRSRTVTMNRAMAEDVFRSENLAELLSAEAVEQVTEEIQGRATSTRARNCDELYELIRTHGSLPCAAIADRTVGDARAMLTTLEGAGRVLHVRLGQPGSAELAIATEDLALFSAAYPNLHVGANADHNSQPQNGQRQATPTLLPPGQGEECRGTSCGPTEAVLERGAAIEEIVRRALVTSGPLLVADLAHCLRLAVNDVFSALIALEAKGFVFRGNFTDVRHGAPRSASDESVGRGSPVQTTESIDAEGPGADVQWCDRHVLERIHRQTLNLLRSSVEPCNDAEFVGFRLKWNGIADVPPRTGIDGVRRSLEQMNGLAFTPDLWERAILPARVTDYHPEHLDLLCMSGEFAWVGAPSQDEFDLHAEFPAIVAFLPRRGRSYWSPCEMPADSCTQTVAEVLTKFGAQHLDQIAERANLSERDTLTGLWRLAAAGLISNDSFAPLRLLAVEPDAARLISNRQSPHSSHGAPQGRLSPRPSRAGTLISPFPQGSGRGTSSKPSRRDAALCARLQSSLSGRWSIVQPLNSDATASKMAETHDAHGSDDAREIALILLRRHGILAREMMALEQIEIPWQQILFALRRLEYAGIIRRGWFVRSLSGEQYALPEALEMLRGERQVNGLGLPIVISAADPANPFGVLLPGCGIAREPDNLLVVQAGRVIAGLSGRSLTSSTAPDQAALMGTITQLMKMRPRLVLESINDEPALESAHVAAIAAMGFHSDGRALVYDGLPGPMPRRAVPAHIRADQN